MAEAGEKTASPATLGFMPPHHLVRDFLPAKTVAALLAFADARQSEFAPTRVGSDPTRASDPAIRVSTGLLSLGEFRPLLKARLLELAPTLIAALRLTPFKTSHVELELIAHGDGAFYRRHIDLPIGGRGEQVRVLSGVYYFHRQPKAFAGGVLRLHPIGRETGYVDIEPICNALLVFPAWAPHEVLPVSVPTGRFADSRFAINCWLWQRRS